MSLSSILVEISRGDLTESIHRGNIAVCDHLGNLLYSAGNPYALTFMRSAAKPIQAIPLVESGAADYFGLNEQEIAVTCGSHTGEEQHVKAVSSILEKIGLTADDLQCGTHRPLNRRVAKEMLACGAAQSTLHNTCSGKHAGMLALCRYWNYPLKDYTSPEHPLQRLMLKTISTFSGTEEKDIKIGIDGCGVPVFALPLANIATAYARLATGRGNNAALYESSCKRVVQAIVNHPQMIGGEKIICTTLIKQGRGKLLAKSGTEAVYCLAHLEKGIGCAFKIEDGAVRALAPTAIEILQQLCWLKEEDLAGLSSLHKPLLKNHSGTIIGCITPHFCLSKNNC